MSIVERIHTTDDQAPETQKRSGFAFLHEAAKTALLTLVVFLTTVTFLAQGYQVFGNCMDPNLRTGERLLGSKLAYRLHGPSRGDIVVFKYPGDKRQIYVKRVIGLPGDAIEISHGSVFVNGKPLNESYLIHPPHGDYNRSIVQPGRLFVLGDNRDCSNDSRYWGQLPVSDIQAKAWVRYWPLTRASLLR